MAKMLKHEYAVRSEKHAVEGKILDYGMVIKLVFSYEGKDIVIGMSRPFEKDMEKALISQGVSIIDGYVEKLHTSDKSRRLALHYWYVDKVTSNDGMEFVCAHGTVSGHRRVQDSTFIHTSEVRNIIIDYENEEALIRTYNSEYHCPLAYCKFQKQELTSELIPDYEAIKEKYSDAFERPTIEDNKVLLVLSNFDEYYFHSIYNKRTSDLEPMDYSGYPHVGMFQDSYLIQTDDCKIDIRYYPHYRNIEFYTVRTENMPLYAENIGDVTLYVKAACGTICLHPGERKEICKDNAETDKPTLANGDLYPAEIQDEEQN